jgi:hypothetical protein
VENNASRTPVVGAVLARLRRHSDHESIKLAMASKGDVTRMKGYKNLEACLGRLNLIDGGNGSIGPALRTANDTRSVLIRRREVFVAAFQKDGSESVRLVYANAVAALWHLVTLLCVEGVKFVKEADGTYIPVANPANKVAESIFATRLAGFVASADKYGFEEVAGNTAVAAEREELRESLGVMVGLAITGLIAFMLLARDLSEKFYSLRGTFSRWLEVQAGFLEMNAATLERNVSRERQEKYAEKLKSLSERIRVDELDTEREASEAIKKDDRELNKVASTPEEKPGSPVQLL